MGKVYAVVKEDLFGVLIVDSIEENKEKAIQHCKWHLREEAKKPFLERRRYFILELEEVDPNEM